MIIRTRYNHTKTTKHTRPTPSIRLILTGEETKRYDFKASKALSPTTVELKEEHNSFSTAKEGKTLKRTLNGKLQKQNARANQNLVRHLAFSSKISLNERLLAGPRRKEAIKKRAKNTNQPKNDLLQLEKNRKRFSKVNRADTTHKRASISVPSPGSRAIGHRHSVRLTPAFLTALAMLLDRRNHFEKDSDALTLARVLVNNGSVLKDGQTALAKTKDRFVPHKKPATLLGGISSFGKHKLRLANSSLLQTTVTGERKSTIHTELINPTELGVSILRLLFGNKAPIVMKSRYKPLLDDHNSPGVTHPTISSLKVRTGTRVKQFEKQNGEPSRIMLDKKRRQKSFSFALAKAVSDIIKSMAKKDLDDYFHKLNRRPKPSEGIPSKNIPSRYWPSTKKVDVKGNRKSWVLLKIPKVSEAETIDQKVLADMPQEDQQAVLDNDETELDPDKEKETTGGVVDTLGKLNDAENVQSLEKNLIGGLWRGATKNASAMISDSPMEPTPRVGYSVRVLPSLRGRSAHDHTTIKPTNKGDPTSKNAATFALAVKKLLQAVQSSIKTLQGKHLIRSSGPTHKPLDPVPRADTHTDANTGSIREMNTKQPSQDSKEKGPFLERLEEQMSPSLGELATLTKVTGQDDPLSQANVMFDPLKDLESSSSDPITKSNSPTRSTPGPSENVLFESNTELGLPKDRQESSTLKHLKEGTL